MHQRNRIGVKSSTWHSGTKASKKEMAFLRTPSQLSTPGNLLMSEGKYRRGYKLSWGTVWKGGILLMAKQHPLKD
jgi:hypothetical protein